MGNGKKAMMGRAVASGRQGGVALIEVMVAAFIILVGVLGLIAVQARVALANVESYQRAQGITLANDMASRIAANRMVAECFAVTTDHANGIPYLGQPSGGSDPNIIDAGAYVCDGGSGGTGQPAVDDLAADEVLEWDEALKGANEERGGSAAGAMIGARGCVGREFDAAANMWSYTVAVAWQGNSETFSPSGWGAFVPDVAKNCAKGLYGNDANRRVAWTSVRVANLN